MPRYVVSNILGLVGAVAGGLLGYWAFFWIASQGFYALILPGAFLGLGCSLLARHRSLARGIICGIAGFFLGLYTDWRFEPFVADKSFRYFVTHFYQLVPVTLIMIGLGTAIAFWMGKDSGYESLVRRPDA
jgi:hypothetical protein